MSKTGTTTARATISPVPSMTPLTNGKPALTNKLDANSDRRRVMEMPEVKMERLSEPVGGRVGMVPGLEVPDGLFASSLLA